MPRNYQLLKVQLNLAKQTADNKGKVITQSAQPDTADRLPQNLWIDTTGNANTPKRWNGSAWVSVSDKIATDAAAAVIVERNARTSADSAMATDISNVQSSINTLSTSVQTIASAQTTADGKASAMWGVKLQVNSNGQYVTAGVGLGLDNSGGILI